MSKDIPNKKIETILKALSQFPQGGSVEEISAQLSHQCPRRTLQRYLSQLVQEKKLNLVGRGRGSRYQITIISQEISPKEDQKSREIPFSIQSKEIREILCQPLHMRRPVGFNQKFLHTYRPNKTFYLPLEVRKHLFEIGQSPGKTLPAGTHARKIFQRLLIDLSWNSSRLEGNTYSLLETERLLKIGETAEGKDARETQMILNHKAAIELLVDDVATVTFNRYTLLNLHALLSQNLLENPQACGRLRSIAVGISGTVFHPLEVPQRIEEYFDKILETTKSISDPFEQAFFMMVHIPYLQPFEDVNKRVSRLAANISLIKKNLCPLSFVDVPHQNYVDGILGVYELNQVDLLRDVFVWAYERSCARYSAVRQSLGEPDPFRLRYRLLIAETIGDIVKKGITKKEAPSFIRKLADREVTFEDQSRFLEVVETELMSLHEGNIARYLLRPSEYLKWQKTWR